jgi:hypothetical protein
MECVVNYEGRIRALPRACVLGVIAPAPVLHALQAVAALGRRGRTAPQYECLCDGHTSIMDRRRREEVLGGPLWGKTRNRVYRFTTDIRTTHGQTAFGDNVQTIISSSNKVKSSLNTYRWTRRFNECRTHIRWRSNTKNIFYCELIEFPNYSGKAQPQCQATPVDFGSPYRRFVRGLSIYVYQLFILTDF